MKQLKYILSLSVIFAFVSCIDTTNNKLIVGEWHATEWIINGSPSVANAQNTSFTFTESGEYSFTNSGHTESGTYKVEKDMLFVKVANQREMMVKINKITNDSLVFDMSRGGSPETLTLLKK